MLAGIERVSPGLVSAAKMLAVAPATTAAGTDAKFKTVLPACVGLLVLAVAMTLVTPLPWPAPPSLRRMITFCTPG